MKPLHIALLFAAVVAVYYFFFRKKDEATAETTTGPALRRVSSGGTSRIPSAPRPSTGKYFFNWGKAMDHKDACGGTFSNPFPGVYEVTGPGC